MRSNLNFFSDQKFRSLFYQTLVVGLFALGIYYLTVTTAINLEKRNIATGWSFLNNPAGFDISFSPFLDFKSTDTHLKVYYVGVLKYVISFFHRLHSCYYIRFFCWHNQAFSQLAFKAEQLMFM